MNREQFKTRTKQLALRVIRLVQTLPQDLITDVIAKQLLRSGTSIGANYRAACRAKSPADYIHKLKIVEEEGDETLYWLELLVETAIIPEARLTPLMQEVDEIIAMTVTSIKTAKAKNN
jgi:four helix bundle protein